MLCANDMTLIHIPSDDSIQEMRGENMGDSGFDAYDGPE